ncbi:MAG: DnaD domain protein [Eubacterium ramulus]
MAEQYLGRTLTQSDLNTIFFWYDELKLSTEVIEVIIENCVAKGKTSLHYMQKIAEDFAAQYPHGKEAKTAMNQGSSLYYAVLKAFGIRGRNLVPPKAEFSKAMVRPYGLFH